MPLNQNIEKSHRVTHPAFEIGPNTMTYLLEMTNHCQHRQDSFNHHAVIPCSSGTNLQIGRVPTLFPKMGVGKNEHFLGDGINQVLKGAAIINIGRVHIPVHNQADMVEQQAQFTADNPAFVGQTLFANLLGASPFSPRMNQFDAIAIDDPDQAGVGHKAVNPLPMGIKQPKQARSMGQMRKQVTPIISQPAVEGAITTSFEGKQQRQRDYFARVKGGLGMFYYVKHLVINMAKQGNDKIFGRHWILLVL
jgi:hypothetical protein